MKTCLISLLLLLTCSISESKEILLTPRTVKIERKGIEITAVVTSEGWEVSAKVEQAGEEETVITLIGTRPRGSTVAVVVVHSLSLPPLSKGTKKLTFIISK